MSNEVQLERARIVFAHITSELEDAIIVAVNGQGITDLDRVRQTSDHLITVLRRCMCQLRGLRSQVQ